MNPPFEGSHIDLRCLVKLLFSFNCKLIESKSLLAWGQTMDRLLSVWDGQCETFSIWLVVVWELALLRNATRIMSSTAESYIMATMSADTIVACSSFARACGCLIVSLCWQFQCHTLVYCWDRSWPIAAWIASTCDGNSAPSCRPLITTASPCLCKH